MRPFFSIIIPTFNSASTLDAALQSLVNQSLRDFEIVISDGASKDRTIEIAKSYSTKLPFLHISTRPDNGVYDAINQGLTLCGGKWILILGSDDQLFSFDTLEKAWSQLQYRNAYFVYGDVLINGSADWAHHGQIYNGEFDLDQLLRKNICQQAIFYNHTIFSLLGTFNVKYRMCADWDFAFRVFARYRLEYIPLTICIFKIGGLSSRNSDLAFRADKLTLLMRYFGLRILNKSFCYLRWDFHKMAKRLFVEKRQWLGLAAFLTYIGLSIRDRLKV